MSNKVVIKMPFEDAKVIELADASSYESFCNLKTQVGINYAESISFAFDDTIIGFCDEEGKLKDLPINFDLTDRYGNVIDVICGGVFFLGVDQMDESDTCGLSDGQITKIMDYLNDYSFVQIIITGE